VVNLTPLPIYPWERTQFNRRLVEPRAGLDGFGEEKNLLSLPEFEPGTIHPVAWSLCRLRYLSLERYIPKQPQHNFNQYMSNKL
jgi:hypothetical protein